ncbi:unnamed protein product [Prunus armeniaca]
MTRSFGKSKVTVKSSKLGKLVTTRNWETQKSKRNSLKLKAGVHKLMDSQSCSCQFQMKRKKEKKKPEEKTNSLYMFFHQFVTINDVKFRCGTIFFNVSKLPGYYLLAFLGIWYFVDVGLVGWGSRGRRWRKGRVENRGNPFHYGIKNHCLHQLSLCGENTPLLGFEPIISLCLGLVCEHLHSLTCVLQLGHHFSAAFLPT